MKNGREALEKFVSVSVRADAASIVELKQCLQAGSLSLAELCRRCHNLLEQLFHQLAKDAELQVLLASEGLLQDQGFWRDWELNLLLCSDSRMAQWNCQFRGQDKPTDILSFPAERCGGDLLLSLPSWLANCREFTCSPDEELQRLLLHGLLHLVGLDHYIDEELEAPRSPMLLYQETLLKQNQRRILL